MHKVAKSCVIFFFLALIHQNILGVDIAYRIDFSSRYIWRGFDLNPYGEPVIQPSMSWKAGRSGLSISLWSSFSFVSRNNHELDLTLSYERRLFDTMMFKAGLIQYGWYFRENYRFEDDTNHEIFMSLGLPDFLLEPELAVFYDFTVGDGFYAQLDVGYSQPLLDGLEAGLHSSLGYNGGQWLVEGTDPGFSDFNISPSLTCEAGGFRLAASVHWTFILLDAVGQEDYTWFKVSLIFD